MIAKLTSNKVVQVSFIFIISFLMVLLAAQILNWSYEKIEGGKVAVLEERIEEIQAKDLIKDFVRARIEKNEKQAALYLTERAMEQKIQGSFSLIDDFVSFEILRSEKIVDDFQFLVKLHLEREFLVERIKAVKILDKYYIDSVEIAG